MDEYPVFYDLTRILCVVCQFNDIIFAVQAEVSADIHKSVTKVTHNRGTV